MRTRGGPANAADGARSLFGDAFYCCRSRSVARLRTLMRGLSRINRAYGRCMEELRGSGRTNTEAASFAVTADQVLMTARRIMADSRLDGWVEAVVGGKREARP